MVGLTVLATGGGSARGTPSRPKTRTIKSAMRRAGRDTRPSSHIPHSLTPPAAGRQNRAMAALPLVLSAALLATAAAQAPAGTRPPPTVAVSYFDNNTGKPEYDPLAKG